ncbi:hypothetical protein [Polyangium aurulentum]|uniref:hypothetical protein n=1 Tax=Polyangium aurulentum TaxID=2567896 RepID=UPI0010AEE04B|nr:hypothetical protein [Polyangium aurulentum]UQA57233.1 hypothetical protein E8A73_039000 [Polyangium aurulentum]
MAMLAEEEEMAKKENPVPEIEPPCPACLATRSETNGEVFWCNRHSEHHPRAHTYHYQSEGPVDVSTEAYGSTPRRGA